MAVVRAQEASSSSSRFTYDVFLSFRGEDVRKTFLDHLYKAMVQARFRTFRDDDEIKRGKNIKLELEELIQQSKISIVVLSNEYVFSSRCLDELLMILDCRRTFGQVVLPVFYHVDPSSVRKQKGGFEEAFRKYEEQFNAETDNEMKREMMDKMKKWREALREIADLAGMYLQNQTNGDESKFIQKIVQVIADKLNHIACHPVGIHSSYDFLQDYQSNMKSLKVLNAHEIAITDGLNAHEIAITDGKVKSGHPFAWKPRKSSEILPSLPGLTNIHQDELLVTLVLKNKPARFIPTAPFINLVALDMSHNKLKQVWQGIMFLPSLKILNLSYSKYLSTTPDFSGVLNLERLILQGCASLDKVSESIGLVKRLTLLDLEDCRRLTNLPRSISTSPRLETLILSGCSRLEFTTELGVEWDTKDIKEIHLRNNKLSELPDNPKCPALVKLFLQSNYDLTEIPGTFFEDMPLLQVLDLSNTSIKSLDIPSISRLVELQELLLRGCELLMELPPQIGALGNLKVFDLEGTELVCLPKELGELINLECLKVSLYGYADSYKESKGIDAIIPRTTLSKLTQLKELTINVDPYGEWWNVEVKAIFEELPSLRKLETLKLYVPTAELLQQFLQLEWNVDGLSIYANLSHFRLIVGSQQRRLISRLPHDLEEEFLKLEKCLKYINGEGKTDGFAGALKHANALFLDRHWTIEKLSVFKMDELNELEVCLLVDCNEMQTVFDGNDFYEGGSLQSLLYLGIYYLKNLEFIWKGPVVGSCLAHLKILALHVCPNLTTIFSPMLLQNLVNLEEIIVDDCPKIETLVIQDSSHIGSDHVLPSLKKLSLLDLPELVKISSGQCIAPNLERMVIYNCPKLKILSCVEVCNKEIMEIKGESEWWNALEWNEPEWSIGQPDYLCRAFKELDVEKDLMDQSISSTRIFPEKDLMDQSISSTRIFPNLLMKDREALNSEEDFNSWNLWKLPPPLIDI